MLLKVTNRTGDARRTSILLLLPFLPGALAKFLYSVLITTAGGMTDDHRMIIINMPSEWDAK
jgi:hypothetical protein